MDRTFRVVVVGCGGIASHFVPYLIRSLEFQAPGSTIILIDGDSYEDKNMNRQVFTKLGNKAQVLRNDIAPGFPNTVVIAKAAWIVAEGQEGEDEQEGISRLAPSQLFEEGDFVFSLVDNFATRKIIFDAGKDFEEIDILTGGNDEQLFGSMYHYIRREGEDYTAHPGTFHEEFVNPGDKNPGSLSCEERAKIEGGTQIVAANQGVSVQLLAKVSHYMLGTEEQKMSSEKITEVMFNLADGSSMAYDWRAEQPVADSEVSELAVMVG